MRKKYLLDVVITNKKTGESKFIEEVYNNRMIAEEKRTEILKTMPKGCYSHWAKIFPLIKCHCGEDVVCSNFTNTCDNCESDYNFAGDLLAPREQWGEETGEHWSECY